MPVPWERRRRRGGPLPPPGLKIERKRSSSCGVRRGCFYAEEGDFVGNQETRSQSGAKPGAGRNPEFQSQVIRTSEQAKKKGSAGGKKSGEVRRENARRKRDAREAVRFILDLAAQGQLAENLEKLGVETEDQTNMAALQASLFTYAMRGDLNAYKTLMKMAGYDPEENREERESIAADAGGKLRWRPRSQPWGKTRTAFARL